MTKMRYHFAIEGTFSIVASTKEEAQERALAVVDHIGAHMEVETCEVVDEEREDTAP